MALAAVAYRLLTIFSNILGPYVLLSPIDLKKRAGASWAGSFLYFYSGDVLSYSTQRTTFGSLELLSFSIDNKIAMKKLLRKYKIIVLNFKQKIHFSVVTGATDGIGKAYAFELARRGFNVLLVSRTQSKLDETKKEILEKYSSIEVRTAAFDFTNAAPSAYKDLLATLNQVEIGVLINNVGMSYEYPDVLHKVDGGIERLANITTINTLPPTLVSFIRIVLL